MPDHYQASLKLDVNIPPSGLPGVLTVPEKARGAVLFAHGSGSSRLSVRNTTVADALHSRGFATLLFDLLTPVEARDREAVFDIPLLASRLEKAIRYARQAKATSILPVGLFGASTGAAAALVAAATWPDDVDSVVCRGGRPDLAGDALATVRAPVLLIVGGADRDVMELNRAALARLSQDSRLAQVAGAGHLFEEPGALEEVATLAADWFARTLGRPHEP